MRATKKTHEAAFLPVAGTHCLVAQGSATRVLDATLHPILSLVL